MFHANENLGVNELKCYNEVSFKYYSYAVIASIY